MRILAKLTGIFGKTNRKRRLADFLFEEILLIQKEDNRGVGKPFVVANRIKQL